MSTLLHWTPVLSTLLAILLFPTWHIRWLGSLLYYFFLRRFAPSTEPDSLFAPIVMTRRCSPFEYDVNGHKSNSTYFLDADVSVGELIPRLASESFHLRRKGGRFSFPRLGAVGGVFLKELKLFQQYRLSTRVVAWDAKWIYLTTKFSAGKGEKKETIFAIVLSKVVFKQGRETVSPQEVFEESGLLPVLGDGDAYLSTSGNPDRDSVLTKAINSDGTRGRPGDMVDMEKKRKAGLNIVKSLLEFEPLRNSESETSFSDFESMHSLW